MTAQTNTERFTLDESKAREWLERAAAKHDYEWRDGPEPEPGTDNRELPEIGSDWNPREYEQESTIYLLVRLARDHGIIAAPEGMDLDFRFSDDSDGGYYCFHVGLAEDIFAELASYSQEMRKISDSGGAGIDAAMSILREAVMKGNHALNELERFIARRAPAPVASKPT